MRYIYIFIYAYKKYVAGRSLSETESNASYGFYFVGKWFSCGRLLAELPEVVCIYMNVGFFLVCFFGNVFTAYSNRNRVAWYVCEELNIFHVYFRGIDM